MKKIKEEMKESMTEEQIKKEHYFMRQFTKLASILDAEYPNTHADLLKKKTRTNFRKLVTTKSTNLRLKSVNMISVIEQ